MQVVAGLSLPMQAFKRWVPSLPEVEINVVLTSKSSATSGLVNIISYDLLVKMAKDAQAKKFKTVIAVCCGSVARLLSLT